jgi:antitoxin MazE
MRVFKQGNGLVVQKIPEDVVHALELKAGDEIDAYVTRKRGVDADRSEVVSTMTPEQALERIRALAVPLPSDWKFDRDQINSR